MFKKNNRSILKTISAVFLLLIISLLVSSKTEAASLYLSPASSTVSVGNIFSVKVIVNTSGKPINNAESIIQFPVDMLEVVSVSKSSSIFSLSLDLIGSRIFIV